MSTSFSSAILIRTTSVIRALIERQKQGVSVVGVFDSGIGGLSVLPSLTQPTQPFDVYYRGDTQHFPYGEKTEVELLPLVLADLEYLIAQGCSLIGIACNTASIVWRTLVTALPTDVQKSAQQVVVDTISTTISALEHIQPRSAIGIIGTTFTVQSGAYEQAIRAGFPQSVPVILQSARQELVDAIERGEAVAIEAELARIREYFQPHELDVFILGCTHYGHVAAQIAKILPSRVQLLDPSVLLGERLRAEVLKIISHDQPKAVPTAPPTTNITFTK